jgi:arsenate reductase (thioredoxin)
MRVLARQAFAEFVGSAGLVTVVIGSGIAAARLSPGDVGLELLENALVTGAGLAALILAFSPASGAHLNPVVTLADRVFGGVSTRQVLTYLPAQLAGGVLGAVLANVMFDLDAVSISTHHRSSGGLWLSEALATYGLVVLVFALVRSGRTALAPFAVGAYIAAAYWWSSSTSFANPMIDLARMLSNTFAGIAPASVPMFVLMQLAGAAAGVATVAVLYPELPMTGPTVLFACIHNSGRSVAAAALARHHGGGSVQVRSAGSDPGDGVNPMVAAVLAERGLPVDDHIPTRLDPALVSTADVVVTMGCGETCPVFPGKRYEDWPVEDPAGKDVETVRRIVDDIDVRVRALLRELAPLPGLGHH